jgi:hypothetical protein
MASKDWLALELIRGVSDTMLQKKLLQEQDPSLKQLVRIAEQWQAADSAQTAFGTEATEYVRQAYTEEEREETEYIRKASNYKQEINQQWKSDRQQNDRWTPYDRQQNDRRTPNDRQQNDRLTHNIDRCQGCGAQGQGMHNRGACPAVDRDCFRCGTIGHYGRVCKNPKPQSQSRYVQKMVRAAETHGGGADPTPMMRNIKVFPRDGGKQFTFEMCPDTGCTMTLISEDVAARQGLTMDTRSRKRVRAVNGQRLNNSGTVTFGIEYQGRTTEVEALVSSSIKGEVLLSWQVLQKLGVINNSFPNIEIKAAVVSTTLHPTDIRNERDAKSKLTKMIKEFDRVFNEDGPLRTMKGDPMRIHIKPDVKVIPLNVCTPRKTPIA